MNKLKFELHTHTVHSDGAFSPRELVECAKRYGYDGIALTDHNTTSGCLEAVEWGHKLGITVIPGIEWTTFYGHITVLGGRSKVNWIKVNPSTVVDCILEAKSAGDIVGMAHPYRVGYPVCTGGRNCFPEDVFQYLDFYEALSDKIEDPTNLRSKAEYFELRRRFNVTATYGRDWHRDSREPNATYGATYLLSPNDVVTVEEAISLIKQGKTMILDCDGKKNLLEDL